jgi:DNA-binding MarR family transcriptional regulator
VTGDADEARPLDAAQLAVYFALMETSSLLQFAVERQLRADGGISWVQFQILAGLNDLPSGAQRMTDVADRVVYSRSGLTYQARELEKAGYVKRTADKSDERASVLAITRKGRALVKRVLPGHVAVVRAMLLDHLDPADAAAMTRVLSSVRDQMRADPPRSSRTRRATRPNASRRASR